MKVYLWTDRHSPAIPRAMMQRGECNRDHCGQFSVSISNGEIGLTVRFDSEVEFRQFMEQGAVRQPVNSADDRPAAPSLVDVDEVRSQEREDAR